jgi:hypothetical protein
VGADNLVEIIGNGARLQAADGLYFGYFDPATGEPASPPTDPSNCGASSTYAANAYTMINLEQNQQVVVRDFEFDGNMGNLVLGEACNDGRQLFGYGLRAYNNEDVLLENIYAHHNALDGIVFGYTGLTEGEPAKPHIIRNLRSEYNARQGLSWVGGNHLVVDGCQLNHTGKGRFGSPPGAGLDIEAETAVIRNGLVNNCEMINNSGPALVSDSGDGGYTTVRNSTLWGTTSWALVARNPGMVFEDSYIYGTVPNPYGAPNNIDNITDGTLATRFTRCHFEDLEYGELGVYVPGPGSPLLQLAGNNVTVEDSTIIANSTRAVLLDGSTTREILRNSTVVHGADATEGVPVRSWQSLFRGAYLENVIFREVIDNPPAEDPATNSGWYILANVVGDNASWENVCVDGPWVRWNTHAPIPGRTGCVDDSP